MKKKVYKIIFSWDYEKEIKWLNEMSAQGWHLVNPGLISFEFEKDEPNKYQYEIEYLDNNKEDYFEFLQETGIEIIKVVNNWAYYKKLNDGNPFEIFNDAESKINHLNRIKNLFIFFFILEGMFLIMRINDMINGGLTEVSIITVILLGIITLLFGNGIYKMNKTINKIKKTNL